MLYELILLALGFYIGFRYHGTDITIRENNSNQYVAEINGDVIIKSNKLNYTIGRGLICDTFSFGGEYYITCRSIKHVNIL